MTKSVRQALLLLTTMMVLFLGSEARLNEQPVAAAENDMSTSPRDDVPVLQLHQDRALASTCAALWSCENFAGFDGRLVHKQAAGFKILGVGCRNKCVGTGLLTPYLEFLGWDCGPCPA